MAQDWKLSDWKTITVDSQELTVPEHNAWAITYLGECLVDPVL